MSFERRGVLAQRSMLILCFLCSVSEGFSVKPRSWPIFVFGAFLVAMSKLSYDKGVEQGKRYVEENMAKECWNSFETSAKVAKPLCSLCHNGNIEPDHPLPVSACNNLTAEVNRRCHDLLNARPDLIQS